MTDKKKIPQAVYDRAAREVQARNDAIDVCIRDCQRVDPRCDAQLAPIWAEKLRHSYAKMPETIYPDLPVANGELLPIDSSVNPATLEYEYFIIDSGALWDWIGEDGMVAPTAFVSAKRFTGKHASFAGGHKHTLDEMAQAAYANVPLSTLKQAAVKRAHDEFVQWTWLFGAPSREVYGLCTHPNLPVSMAALNGGATSRLPVNKTNDEILADFTALIDSIPIQSVEAHHCAKVKMSFAMGRLLKRRRISGTAEGKVTLWDVLVDQYKGDETGQGKVEFSFLLECEAARRIDKRTGTDTSGISGDFMIALPPDNVDELAFIRCRNIEQLPPEQHHMVIEVLARADIGGCRMVRPFACAMMLFGTT